MNHIRIVLLFFLLVAALIIYFRKEVRLGYEYLGSRLIPSLAVGEKTDASGTGAWAQVELKPFASGFKLPVYLASAGDGTGRVFVVEKPGRIKVMKGGRVLPEPFLDIVRKVRSRGSEQGLLSVAFHPRYGENGRFFVNYTDLEGDTVVSEFSVSDNPDRAEAGSERVLLGIGQPAANHNGGQLQFGPDGYLYIGTGDGGSAGDPSGNAQNLDSLLGKMLRIDTDGDKPYGIPGNNPFVGETDARPEIWAYGLRNPWRFSFDMETDDMYIADVGQNKWEEIDFQPSGSGGGENYGWNPTEGMHSFRLPEGYDTSGITFPVHEYGRGDGCSVTGGYVYRGERYPALKGTYLFSDYCTGKLWGLRKNNGSWEWSLLLDTDLAVSSFGEDEEGNVYILDYGEGRIFTITSNAD